LSFSTKILSIFKRDLLLFVTNILTGVFVARTLGPTMLGVWMILSLVPAYAESFGRSKADVASVYFIGQKRFLREDILFNINLIALVSSAVVLAVIFWQFDLIYEWLFSREVGDFKAELFVIIIQIPLNFFYLNFSYFHLANENIHIYNRMLVIFAWVNSSIAITLLLLTSLGLWAVIFASLFSLLLTLLYGWYSIDRKSWKPGHFSGKVSFAMIRYALHFYWSGILGQFQQSGTNLIAVSYLLTSQIAFLGQGQGVGRILHKMSNAINDVLYPRISKSSSDVINITCKSFRISSILLLCCGLILAYLAEPLIIFLYGDPFRPTIEVVYYLLPGLIATGASSSLISFFNGTGRAKLIPRIQILPILIQILLAFQLIELWGLVGAVLSITVGMVLYAITLIIVFINVAKIPANLLVPKFADFRYLIRFAFNNLETIFGRGKKV